MVDRMGAGDRLPSAHPAGALLPTWRSLGVIEDGQPPAPPAATGLSEPFGNAGFCRTAGMAEGGGSCEQNHGLLVFCFRRGQLVSPTHRAPLY